LNEDSKDREQGRIENPAGGGDPLYRSRSARHQSAMRFCQPRYRQSDFAAGPGAQAAAGGGSGAGDWGRRVRLGMATRPTFALAINPVLNPNLGYDPIKDFAPVTALVSLPTIFVANPTVPAGTLAEFIALARSEPGRMSFGSAGAGSIHHLTMAIFAEHTGI